MLLVVGKGEVSPRKLIHCQFWKWEETRCSVRTCRGNEKPQKNPFSTIAYKTRMSFASRPSALSLEAFVKDKGSMEAGLVSSYMLPVWLCGQDYLFVYIFPSGAYFVAGASLSHHPMPHPYMVLQALAATISVLSFAFALSEARRVGTVVSFRSYRN